MCLLGFRLTGVRDETVNKDGDLMNSETSAAGGSHLPENQSSAELERFRVEEGLPTYLDKTRCGHHCRLSEDKLSAKYSGTAIHDDDVGAVQANLPVPLERKLPYYFEITVENVGRRGEIAIGFTGENFSLSEQLGLVPNSYGYSGVNGRLSRGQEIGLIAGDTFSAGDTVCAGLNYATKEILFIKNGRLVGKAALLGTTEEPLYPTIGLHSPNEKVVVNFGQRPFVFDPVQRPSSEEDLPTYLDNRRCGNHCRLSEDKLSAKYFGEYSGDHDENVGAAQANLPVYLQRLRYYFEITVVDQGQSGYIAIGFTGQNFPLRKQPGWEPYSYGYHGDDGRLYRGGVSGAPFGPTFSAGDTVGAGLNYETKEIFFTKNGGLVGTSALVGTTVGLLYPTIGLHSPNEEVVVNFGQRPFAFVQPAVESVPL